MAAKFHHQSFSSLTKDKKTSVRSEHKIPFSRKKNGLPHEPESPLFQQWAFMSPDLLFLLNTDTLKTIPVNKRKSAKGIENSINKWISENKLLEKVIPEDSQRLLEMMRHFYEKNGRKDFEETEIRIPDPEGKVKFFHLRFTPYSTNEENQIKEWFCLLRNITNKKDALKANKDHQLNLQMALNGSKMGIWSYEPSTKRFEADSRTCAILGLTEEKIKEGFKPIFSRIHPEDRGLVLQTALNTLRRKGCFNHDFRILMPGSSIIKHVVIIGELVTHNAHNIPRLSGICLDISKNKEAENKIRTNEAFLEESQRIAKIGCFDWDLILDKVHCTRQFYEIIEISTKSLFTLQNLFSKIHPQDRSAVESTVNLMVKKGLEFNKEFRFLGKNGVQKVLWVQAQAFRNRNLSTRIIGTIQDVSEKRQREKELNTQNLIINKILHNLPVIIQTVDKQGTIKNLLGPIGLGRIGMEENENVGKTIFDKYPLVTEQIEKVFKGETVNFTQEVIYQGRKFFLLSFFFYDSENDLAIGFSIDMTPQKQVEAAFHQISAKNRELERMNKVMDMFVYAVAHDLKNPINNLEILHQLMEGSKDPKEQQEYIQALQKSVKRLKHTITGLTEIIEIESSRQKLQKEVYFSSILKIVKADLQLLLNKKNGKIDAVFHVPKILYNQAFLISILKNLISNSIKYSYPGRDIEINIKTEKKRGYILLVVEDNGIGIDLQQYGKNLFKPFKRFTKQAEGTGVGLHLIKSMVEKNGGQIEVESTLGKGTIFRCFLKAFNK